ncbi:YdeI/OmpD-associated family protein [Anditalea andensis]|uniref:DUF1905 domain-containing protein n=1 Tax=Anditalea andensis TaxID=1048983 RepID=A0A074L5S1_9BACT|nr:YdeI/OmpD-associated family protein [Anditalea andensis]KEO75850.1 hypothetical protein EL17_22780 [Anditalea andensis]
MDTFFSKMEKFDSNLWQYHIPIPHEIAANYIEGENRRVYCTLNGRYKTQCALMKSKSYWYVLINKEIRNNLAVDEGDMIAVLLEKDHTEFGHHMPEELQVMLDQDQEGNNYFRMLTPGKQRSLVYIVTTVKNPDSRLRKSLAIIHHLKEVKGVLDFKMLNETIKYYNNNWK